MASKNLFVNIQTIKDEGLVHDNVNNKIIEVCLKRSQDIELQNILGTCLFKDIDLRIVDQGGESGDQGFDPDHKKLMDEYIIPFLIVAVDARVAKYQNKQIRNKTTGKNSDEIMTALSDDELVAMKDDIKHDSGMYAKLLKGYLEDNKETFPLYCDCDCNEENVQPKTTTYNKVFYS